MYDNPACSRMIEAPKPGFTKLFCEGRASQPLTPCFFTLFKKDKNDSHWN
jgi:hypothetical protein